MNLTAQDGIKLTVHQDARLLVLGDNKGNDAGTLNLLTRVRLEGKQSKHGYLFVAPEFELAQIEGDYMRYGVQVGVTLNNIFKDWEYSVSTGYGFINRYGLSSSSFGGALEASYKIFDGVSISALAQLTQRTDLGWLHGKTELRGSGFIGVQIEL